MESKPPRNIIGPPARAFVCTGFDYLLIGGGLSLAFVIGLYATGTLYDNRTLARSIPWLVLLSNSAHFAASTVRLYTKPNAFGELPFLTMGLPLVSVVVLTLAVVFADHVGQHLHALYATWSPFHYAAQAYGLAVMYAMRSGTKLDPTDRRLLRSTAMLPFVYALFAGPNIGVGWLVPSSIYAEPMFQLAVDSAARLLSFATFLAPVALFLRLRSKQHDLPAISWLLLLTNGIWWVVFSYWNAFVWATVFHGIQYLAIVTIFHLRDHHNPAPETRSAPMIVARFYAACLLLGYLLFEVWPYAYVGLGFTLAESMLLTTAVINIHHFMVDRGIWRLGTGSNTRVVLSTSA